MPYALSKCREEVHHLQRLETDKVVEYLGRVAKEKEGEEEKSQT